MKINKIKLIVVLVLLSFSFLGMIQTLSLVYDINILDAKNGWYVFKNSPVVYFYGIALFSGAYLLASIKQNEK